MAVKRSTTSAAKKLENQNTTVSKGTTSIGARPYSSPNTTTNAVKNTAATTTTTAPKSSTTTIGARPYSSPNASSANQGTTAVNKGSGYTSLPYTTPNASAYNQINTTPAPTNPVQNFVNSVAPYAQVAGMASGMVNPAPDTSNITPSSNTSDGSLWDAVVRSQGIAGSAATQPTSNILGNATASDLDARRPYSNPNYLFGEEESDHHHGGGGHHAFGDSGNAAAAALLFGAQPEKTVSVPEGVGKGSLGNAVREQAALDSLLDTLSSEGIPGYEVPYSSPNAGSAVNSYVGDTTKSGDTNINYGGGSGSGSSGGGYYGGLDAGGIDVSALYDLLNQRLGEYEGNYTSLLDLLANNYGDLLNALGLNYSDTEALLNGQFTNSKNELEAARRRALQEAYISRMMQEKSLSDQLDAYGLTGGAAESVMANMRNNYANNRYQVEENLQNNLRELLMNYLNNLSGARQRYNDSLINAQNNRFNALTDAVQTRSQQRDRAYEDLYNTLANLTMKGIRYGS